MLSAFQPGQFGPVFIGFVENSETAAHSTKEEDDEQHR